MQDCFHGEHHEHHRHQHVGLAEGMKRPHLKRLRLVMVLSAFYLAAQIAGAYWSGSLALLAEAGHKFSDVSFIALALIAAWFAGLAPTPQKTFGFARIEVVAAFLNGLALVWVAGFILYEAYSRLSGEHHHVEGNLMLWVASGGFLINLACMRALHPSIEENLNVKSAFYHITADLLGSAGTIVSALLIIFFEWHRADSVLSVLIAMLVLYNAIRLLRESTHILMDATPKYFDPDQLELFIRSFQGVLSVHDLHVWTITTGKDALLAHVVVEPEHFNHETVDTIEHGLRERYDLCHITLQIEPPDFADAEARMPF
jgi:cobalt-zinc-cadmium efflux system protein